jgi:hypothetical protein
MASYLVATLDVLTFLTGARPKSFIALYPDRKYLGRGPFSSLIASHRFPFPALPLPGNSSNTTMGK